MCRKPGTVLLAFVVQAHAHELGNIADNFVNKLVDKLLDRTLKASPLHHGSVEDTTLGKPAQLAAPTSHLSAASGLPIRPAPFPGVKPHAMCPLKPVPQLTKAAAAAVGAHQCRWQQGAHLSGHSRSRSRGAAVAAQTAPAETAQIDDTAVSSKATRNDLRNIAIVAHVDHGKTTLVDAMLLSAAVKKEIGKDERTMDSNDQERERGITILAKNVAIEYGGTKINIVDTPGHADFGGEVERVLGMVDGVLLLVDASEGPKPQTRFVLKKAIAMGHKVLVVVNKIDRPTARPEFVIDKTFDLFCELGASDEQTDFPIVYTSAINRVAGDDPSDEMKDMDPLFQKIMQLPKPASNPAGPLQLQISAVTSDNFIGRLGIGRITSGSITKNSQVGLSSGPGTDTKPVKVSEVFTFDALGRKAVDEAAAGEIVVFSGIQDFDIGNTIVDPDDPQPLEPIAVEQPTMSMTFGINKSPLGGKTGKFLTGRQIKERLEKELETNVALRVEPTADSDTFLVSGRGLLHLTVLIETMRREGFELMVGCPSVIEKEIDGQRQEPFEMVDIDVPEDSSGTVINLLNERKGCMIEMGSPTKEGSMTIQYEVPTRGMNGVKSKLLTATKGLAVMTTTFAGYRPYAGDFDARKGGSLLSMATGPATSYSIVNAQQRGALFVEPGEEIYEGQIVGENARDGELKMNLCKTKTLDNMRSAGKDNTVGITPKKDFTLEEAVEYIIDGEYVEITPETIRMGVYPKDKKIPRR